MTMPNLGFLTFALALALGAATAEAAPAKGQRGPGGNLCEQIKCSADQKTELGEIMQELRRDVEADHRAAQRVRGEMIKEWAKDKPSPKRLDKLRSDLERHHKEMSDRRFGAMMEMHAVLTAKQRKDVAKLAADGKAPGFMGGPGHKRARGKQRP